jgi:hypothetical protein
MYHREMMSDDVNLNELVHYRGTIASCFSDEYELACCSAAGNLLRM